MIETQAISMLFQRHPELPDGITTAELAEELGGWVTDGEIRNVDEYDEILDALEVEVPDFPDPDLDEWDDTF